MGERFYSKRKAELALNDLYSAMVRECEIDFGNDAPAWREDFHNWKDGLHRDGSICERACDDLCPIGAQFGGAK